MPENESHMGKEAALFEFKKAYLAADAAVEENRQATASAREKPHTEEKIKFLQAESNRLEDECKKAGVTIQEILKNSSDLHQ